MLQNTLEEVQEGHDEYAAKASGLFNKMGQFEIYFGLQLAHIVFAPAEQFSFNVQSVDITVQEAVKGSTLLVPHLKLYRTDKTFHRFYGKKTLSQSESLTEPPKLPTPCKLPK